MIHCKLVVEGHGKFALIVIECFPELVPCYGLPSWSQATGSRFTCRTLQNIVTYLLKVVLKEKKEQLVPDSKVGHHTNNFPSFVHSCIPVIFHFVNSKQLWTCKQVVKGPVCTQGFNIKWCYLDETSKSNKQAKNFWRPSKWFNNSVYNFCWYD